MRLANVVLSEPVSVITASPLFLGLARFLDCRIAEKIACPSASDRCVQQEW
jgi:hypothetical protein